MVDAWWMMGCLVYNGMPSGCLDDDGMSVR